MAGTNAKTIALLERGRCTGCGACVNQCLSISMKVDSEGFLYPQIDDSCTDCGQCLNICPVLSGVPSSTNEPDVYAAWSLNEDVRFNSTSGGVFSELALCVLRSSGFVAGVKYNDALLAEHTVIDNEAGLLLLRQSKYIQSDVKDIYRQTEVLLQAGKQFLFVGTPCQCAALMRYLKKPYDGLVLCDFICRGVNSPLAYRKYLDDLEAEYGSKVKQVWFKNKTYSWQRFCTKVIFENGKEYLADRDTDLFMAGYIKKGRNLYMRPSCGNCEFKGINRPVDITLGDFWGVVLSGSTDTGESGISLVIVHSPKGAELFNQAHLYREPHTVAEALLGNRCLVESARSGSERTAFFERLRKNGFKKAMEEVLTE